MRRKHYFVWMLTVALTVASVMPMTVYAQPVFASGGEVKVVEGDVNGEMQGGVMSPGAMAIEGSDLKVNGNVSGGLVSDSSTVTVNGNVTGNGIDTVIAKKRDCDGKRNGNSNGFKREDGCSGVKRQQPDGRGYGGWRKRIDRRDCRKRVESDSRKCESFRGVHDRNFGIRRQHGSCKR